MLKVFRLVPARAAGVDQFGRRNGLRLHLGGVRAHRAGESDDLVDRLALHPQSGQQAGGDG
ncbi:MAG: hypothetical protein R2748_01925 [Bryobacterales bacterium]